MILLRCCDRAERSMQRVDGAYLYQVGHQIHPIGGFSANESTWMDAHASLLVAQGALEPLITRTVFQLRTSVQTGAQLLAIIRELLEQIMEPANIEQYTQAMDAMAIYRLNNALAAFEAVLAAELALIPLYVVTPKGGLVLTELIENGQVCFPPD